MFVFKLKALKMTLRNPEQIKQIFRAAQERIEADENLKSFFVSFCRAYFSGLGNQPENLGLENLIPMIAQSFKDNPDSFKEAVLRNGETGLFNNPEEKVNRLIEILSPCFSLTSEEIDSLIKK
ncbi:MAG: hypothetical protein AB1721_02535 [Patescibacteria group bacterium]